MEEGKRKWEIGGRSRRVRGKEAEISKLKSDQIFLNLARPGSKTTKQFLSLVPCSSRRIMISSPRRFRAFPGKRIRISPFIFSPCAKTHSPKSLSSVNSIRSSLIAYSRTCWSDTEGKDSATENTSYLADRSLLTIKKSQLSSAKKAISCNLSTSP